MRGQDKRTENRKKLQSLLRELFQFDSADLDFGIYRIMNAKRDEIERFIAEGHFPPGSMGPKVEAIHRFLVHGGRRGLITDPDHLVDALNGKAGTHFVGGI